LLERLNVQQGYVLKQFSSEDEGLKPIHEKSNQREPSFGSGSITFTIAQAIQLRLIDPIGNT